jgi:hypothetical protein
MSERPKPTWSEEEPESGSLNTGMSRKGHPIFLAKGA